MNELLQTSDTDRSDITSLVRAPGQQEQRVALHPDRLFPILCATIPPKAADVHTTPTAAAAGSSTDRPCGSRGASCRGRRSADEPRHGRCGGIRNAAAGRNLRIARTGRATAASARTFPRPAPESSASRAAGPSPRRPHRAPWLHLSSLGQWIGEGASSHAARFT
jgi:hypothetical protein